MVQRTIDDVYVYNGALLHSNGLLRTVALSSFSGPTSGTLGVTDTDRDLSWDAGEAAQWNGADATLIGSGTSSAGVSILGIPINLGSTVPVNLWSAGGRTYVEYPEGDPAALLDGLLTQALNTPFLRLLGVTRLTNLISQNALLNFTLTDPGEMALPVCFGRGTLIQTVYGAVPVEELRAGDLAITYDHGPQEIRWIGSTRVRAEGAFAPVEIARNTCGNHRTLRVSQQHRILIADPKAELNHGDHEVLVPAKHLVNHDTVRIREGGEVEYFHILFDRHEVVFADGAPAESFHPGDTGATALDRAARDEILALFPQLAAGWHAYGRAARVSLRAYEARALLSEGM
ncbi:Hint domain-containing protein [Celeribacter indicus]|uniref:Hedgehog/Intein (Hint) domain-containing protein n=1 Tax=Celeribacter indicus TaxID=1208324 RepID=A0A0B5DWR4_9RHOB|nr:Hint domain-containing protein [Celeribacter indicus]AJE45570.1 hypothetical protein P73_0855 [Celeribacter indicus]SDW85767.1 Hint domain-containing protein [Celeribacter indicus]